MRTLILLLAFSAPLFGQTTCATANFEPTNMSEGLLTSEFKGSILRIQVHGSPDSGTGYLIDSADGYLITAFHVVASASASSTIDVTSPDSKLTGVKLTASVVKSLGALQSDGTVSPPDLAILKIENPLLVKDLRPVDISLRYPSVDQVLYAMGYPKFGDAPNTTFSEQLVRFMASPDDGSIEVTQATFGGNSGGPLMDPSGSVVGTCRESVGIGAAVARYTPMSEAESLLDVIPLTDRMRSLDQKIRSSSISEADLRDLLVKDSTNPTNMELYAWARYILANRTQYTGKSSRALLQCPVRALMQRGMDDVVIELSAFGSPETVADANLAIAEREIAQGHPLSAENHIQAAAADYATANDTLGIYRTAMLSTRTQLAVGLIDAASSQSSKVLVHINSFPVSDKAMALSTAANVDLAQGNTVAAISRLNAASQYSVTAGHFVTAADLLTTSAAVSLKISKPQDAKDSLTKAIVLYRNVGNIPSEAESIYKLVQVESLMGEKADSTTNLKRYLDLQPQGPHATEAREVLGAPRNLGVPPAAVIK